MPGGTGCIRASARLQDGPRTGAIASFRLGDTRADPKIGTGDTIRVVRNPPVPAAAGLAQCR